MTDNPAFWPAIAVIVGPVLGVLTWWLNKRHREDTEDLDSFAGAITAITDANVNITQIVSSLIDPMKVELDRLKTIELTQGELLKLQSETLEHLKNQMSTLQTQFTSLYKYVRLVRRQILDSGGTPPPLPPELDHLEFD